MESAALFWGAILSIGVYFLFFYKSRSVRMLEKIPRPHQYPIVGIIPEFLKRDKYGLLLLLSEYAEEFGSAYTVGSIFGNTVVLNESSSVEKMLTSQVNISKGSDYEYIRPWLGDGLLVSTGQKWAQRRKMLTPAFHFRILEDFMETFNKEAYTLVKVLKTKSSNEQFLDMSGYISRCALDIICDTAMGQTVNAQEHIDSPYIKAIYEFGTIIQYRSIRPWYQSDLIWRLTPTYRRQCRLMKVLHEFTESVIKEKKKKLQQEKAKGSSASVKPTTKEEEENIYFQTKKRRAFLDLLLEVQVEKGESELSDTDIREETDTFMFEGHDTTSTNMSFILYALAAYPEVQEKAVKELEEIFGDDKTRPVTSKDLTQMKYLECVIKETLRVYPSVPFIQRKLTTDLEIDNGRILPKDLTIGINIYQIHRDPKKFPNPKLFQPERFTQDDMKDPFAFVPFSAGARNCIGQKFAMMEEKVVIAIILRNFKLSTNIKPSDLRVAGEMVLRPENGIPIKLIPK